MQAEKGKNPDMMQVAFQAWCTTQILKDIDKVKNDDTSITLKQFISDRMDRTNILSQNKDFPIINIGYIFMLSYALIVVPYDLWSKNETCDLKSLERLEISIGSEYDKKTILKHLRHSIAHVRYEINQDSGKIIFRDNNGKKDTFCATISDEDFFSILEECFKAYGNKYLTSVKSE
jgi:hypothetical protein